MSVKEGGIWEFFAVVRYRGLRLLASWSSRISFYNVKEKAYTETPFGFYEPNWNALEKMERLYHFSQVQGVFMRWQFVRNGEGFGIAVAYAQPPTYVIVSVRAKSQR